MEWFIFALLAPMLWGIVNIIDKYSLEKLMRNSFSYQILICLTDAIVMIPFILFTNISFAYPWYIWSIIVGIILGFIFVFYNKAIMVEETSRVVILTYLNPVFVLPLAFIFLGEVLSLQKYIGVFLLVASAILISYQKSKGKFKISKALGYILILDLMYAGLTVTEKYVFNYFDYMSFLFWTLLGAVISGLIFLIFPKLRKDFFNDMSKTNKKKLFFWRMVSMTLYYVAVIFFYIAITEELASIVAAVPSVQPLFVLIYTLILSLFIPKILKEKNSKTIVLIKILSIVFMFIGTWLMVT